MISPILSFNNIVFKYPVDKKWISAILGTGILSAGLFFFLASCWQFFTQSDQANRLITFPEQVERPAYPDRDDLNKLALLLSAPEKASARNENERFRVGDILGDDALLLSAPRAKINEQVVGILYSSDERQHIVIIESSNGQESYGIGDNISGNWPILKIFPDRVVINEKGFYAMMVLAE